MNDEEKIQYRSDYTCEQCSNFNTNGTICSCESVNVTADLFYECRLKSCACRHFEHQ